MLGFGSAVIEVVGKRQSYFDLGCSTSRDFESTELLEVQGVLVRDKSTVYRDKSQ